MKNIKSIYLKINLILGLLLVISTSCERDLSEDAEFATFNNTAEIFTDTPVGLTDEFFISFDPDVDGANVNGFGTDDNTAYLGTTSIRIDVPAANDPEGGFIGGIFRDRGVGRDLRSYNALTFWAKGSTTATIAEVGFGTAFGDDFGKDIIEDKYAVGLQNIQLSTDWKKYVIPIPDPSKLVQEKGMFLFSAGSQSTGGLGYTFWMDELKFEKLGNIGQPRPKIMDGVDDAKPAFTGTSVTITGLTETFNLGTGFDQTILVAPSYFTFSSSNVDVAQVSERGIVSVVAKGTADITAILAGVAAKGSLKVTSIGALPSAPVPTIPENDVKSIYSDAYAAATSSNFTPNFGGSTTETTEVTSNDDSVLLYANNNYTGILFDNIVDASTLTYLHIDIYTQQAGTNVGIQIRDIGANRIIETDVNTGNPIGDDKDYRFTATGLSAGEWTSFDIPLGGNLTSQKNNLGALIITDGPDFILDNIYFFKQ